MAQQLWLLRHGEAEPHDTRPDPERRLTPRGERQAIAAGRTLRALGVEFAAVFTSPRVRAADTARLACESLGVEPVVHEPLSGGFDAGDARALMAGQDADARVLARRARAGFRQVVFDLTGGRIDLKKGGVAAVRLDGTRAELIVLLRPRELESTQRPLSRDSPRNLLVCPSFPRSRSPRAAWARRSPAPRSSPRSAPGINALKTFDPPLYALEGADDRRRAPARQACCSSTSRRPSR